MTVIEAIRSELLLDATVESLVGSRIYPIIMAQSAAYPAVVMTVVSDFPANVLGGTATDRFSTVRLQVDSYADTYVEAHRLADAVDAVISALGRPELSAQREHARDDFDVEEDKHRVIAEYSVWR